MDTAADEWVRAQRRGQFAGGQATAIDGRIELDLGRWQHDVDLKGATAPIVVNNLVRRNTGHRFFVDADADITFRASSDGNGSSRSVQIEGAGPVTLRVIGESDASSSYRLEIPERSRVHVFARSVTVDLSDSPDVDVEVSAGSVRFANIEGRSSVVIQGTARVAPGRLRSMRLAHGAELVISKGRLRVDQLHLDGRAEVTTDDDNGSSWLDAGDVDNTDDSRTILVLARNANFELCNAKNLRIDGGRLALGADSKFGLLQISVDELRLGQYAMPDGLRGSTKVLTLAPHSGLRSAGGLLVCDRVSLHETSTVEGITLPDEALNAMEVLRSLEAAQDVTIPLTGAYQSRKFDEAEARRIERVIDAGARLARRRCNDGRNRAAWHMQQLRVRRALADNATDRFLLGLRIRLGDATAVRTCCAWWAGCVLVAWPLFVLALGVSLRPNLGSADAWRSALQALFLAVFSVFRLVQVGGTDSSGLPVPAWWAIVLKVPLTLLLASLIAALIRRVRWAPHEDESSHEL